MEQLKNNIAAIDLQLSPDCLNDIHEVYKQYPVAF
jgi:aryl-alcohol dehydrogenase-like predicted oxidoreductase